MTTELTNARKSAEESVADRLLNDPAELLAVLDLKREKLTQENRILRESLERLVDRAAASSDMMLPLIAEDVSRCTEELSMTKSRIALALTGGKTTDAVAELSRRKDALEKELSIAQKLLSEAHRIVPLLNELNGPSGRVERKELEQLQAATPLTGLSNPAFRAEDFFRIPADRSPPQRTFVVAKMLLPSATASTKPVEDNSAALAEAQEYARVKREKTLEKIHLKTPPKPTLPSSTKPDLYKRSIFGKIFGT